mgnify:CR=1 FL=1
MRNFGRVVSVSSSPTMKFRSLTLASLALSACLLSGCATKTTSSGGRETNLLLGAVTYSSDSFQPTSAATVDADTSKIVGRGNPSGAKVSLLWGLITLHDY